MSLEQAILDVCIGRESEYFYIGESIPERKLRNAIREFSLSSDEGESIFALVDGTIFGTAKKGALLTSMGLYIKNDWTAEVREGFISWDDFQYTDIDYSNSFGNKEVWINNLEIDLNGSSLSPIELYKTLLQIQKCISEYGGREIQSGNFNMMPKLPVQNSWMLAVNGEENGPYEEQTVREMIGTNQINPERDHLWKAGMENWVLVNECPPFNKNIAPPPPERVMQIEKKQAQDEEYKPIEVNTASVSDFLSLPYFSLDKANKILLERERLQNGYKSIEQIKDIIDFKPHEFEKIRPYLVLQSNESNFVNKGGRMIDF